MSASTSPNGNEEGRPDEGQVGVRIDYAKGLSPAWTKRFQKFDLNKDGVLDLGEIMQVAEEMMHEKQMRKLFMWMTLGLVVAVAVLIGSLTGSTYAIVQLAKDTKVSANTTSYAFVSTKDGRPTLSSNAVLDISGVRFQPENTTAIGSGRRSLLIQDTSYDYYGHVPIDTVEQGCTLVEHGLISFVLSRSNPDSAIVSGAIALSTLTIKEQTGCDTPDASEVTALVNIANWKASMDFIVDCTVADGCTTATVTVLGKGTVRMSNLQYGDMVHSRDIATGAEVYRPVYVFGHRDRRVTAPFVHITAADRTLKLSPGHFLPLCIDRCTSEDLMTGQGIFDPKVRGADIFVNGVLASPHPWDHVIGPVAPAWSVPFLPYVHEVFLTPAYGLYLAIGPAAMERVLQYLRFEALAEEHGYVLTYLAFFAVLVVVPSGVAGTLLAGAVSKQLRRVGSV
ncbi:hypothetical protein GPECTOR_83g279 [Gonium pectorale]|uniref:EF-hand domain-containing protein n=1 Tax=Gonium pectorale TaxID=33097 RepID=A0A150G1F1_GONPE|nr:hypothetical protein GPECTOR_83g279 [Gonium pectorale]|eukprot:KXZ43667.1 hypothetical protein GPECTOR_83g279 [Gonium pectorale]